MPACLLHLNGPPGVGKSTIARRLVQQRPLALALDIDELRVRLGGWRERPESKAIARALGFQLTAAHLASGHDVVLPQLVARPDVVDDLAALAASAGAAFVEIVLVAPTTVLLDRAAALHGTGDHPRDAFDLATLGEHIIDADERLRELPGAILLEVGGITVDEAAARVAALAGWSRLHP